jgi:Tat protein translocase TatB subunit
MFLLILESIGTAELLLIGLVALIFFGPRKLPEFARILGKWRNELRKTTDDFKDTWKKEVETEVNQFKSEVEKIGSEAQINSIFDEPSENSIKLKTEIKTLKPEIKEVSQEDFKEIISAKMPQVEETESAVSEKRNWL